MGGSEGAPRKQHRGRLVTDTVRFLSHQAKQRHAVFQRTHHWRQFTLSSACN